MGTQMHLLSIFKVKNLLNRHSSSGFTITEILITTTIIGILVGLSVPGWLAFVNTRRLNAAHSEVYWAMRQAQREATKEKVTWQVSISEQDGVVKWAVHPATSKYFISDTVKNSTYLWRQLEPNVRIDQEKNSKGRYETTLVKQPSQPVWRVLFNYQGCPVYKVGDECTSTSLRTLGQITFYIPNNGNVKRCVYISTILGAMRKGKDHDSPNENGKYCY
jgi:prepilin-type N-terminal cleavage/methylation domain-containing protein